MESTEIRQFKSEIIDEQEFDTSHEGLLMEKVIKYIIFDYFIA